MFAIDELRQSRVHDAEKITQVFTLLHASRQMRMVRHETIRVNLNAIAIFIHEKKIVIRTLRPLRLEEPLLIVTLPGDVKRRAVFDDVISGNACHKTETTQGECQSRD